MHRTLLALFMLVTTCSRAHADEVSEAERAQALFRQGAALARQYRWPDALRAFEQAAQLRPHARTSYNLGYCERGLERLTRARHWFRDAIRRDDEHQRSELSDEQRRAAESYLAEAEARIAHVHVEVSPDVRIIVDDRPLDIEDAGSGHALAVAGTRPRGPGEPTPARAFELLVDPGRHEIAISAKDGRQKSIDATVAEGEVTTIRLELPTAPPSKPKRPTPHAPTRAMVVEPAGQIVGAAVLTGLGAAAAVVGTAFAVKAKVTYGEAEDACPNRQLCSSDRAFDLSHEAQTYGNLATATLVTAGTSTVGATLLWITAPSGDGDAQGPTIVLRTGSLLIRMRY